MARQFLVGDWDLTRDILSRFPQRVEPALRKALRQEGDLLRKRLQRYLRDQRGLSAWPALSAWTLAARQAAGRTGTKVLVDTDAMADAISVTTTTNDTGGTTVSVGIPAGTLNSRGMDLSVVARQHEEGVVRTIELTKEMIKFLAVVSKFLPKSESTEGGAKESSIGRGRLFILVIPRRPFMRPVADEFLVDRKEELKSRVGRILSETLKR